jgi:hypothetical protein
MNIDNRTVKHIVVHDPRNEWWEGALVDESPRLAQLVARGVVLLPAAVALLDLSGVGGFHKRSWGAGVPLPSGTPRMSGKLALFAHPDFKVLSWAAKLVVDGTSPEKDLPPRGQLRIAVDTTQTMSVGATISSTAHSCVSLDALADVPPDVEDNSWIVRGEANLHASQVGLVGLSLFGVGGGLRLTWAAVSLS